MAEKSFTRALSTSLRSEDLLSDVELLPASDPPTPGQQVRSQPATPYTSKVTTQLYASLRQSRQAEALALSRLEDQHSSALARKAMDTDVDLDTLAEELSHRLSASVEASAFRQVRELTTGMADSPPPQVCRKARSAEPLFIRRVPCPNPATFPRWRTSGATSRVCCEDPEMGLVRCERKE